MKTQRITQSCLVSLLILMTGCGDSPVKIAAPGDIFVTELMPSSGSAGPQWLELHNSSDASIDLRGCKISNTQDQVITLTDSLIVESQEYAVIASNHPRAKPVAYQGDRFTYQSDLFALPSAGGISLTCNGKLIDKMTYQIGAPTIAATSRSWQLAPGSISAQANDNQKNWCYTILAEGYMVGDRRFATPGLANPVCESVMPYVSYNDQASVLIEGIDWDATLNVAEAEFARQLSTSELPIWAIRDQIITPEVAAKIAVLYFDNIEMLYGTKPFMVLDWNHAVWHLSWAISNLYRNGDSAVKKELQLAYEDAITRPETLERRNYIAIDHIRNDVVVMGDIHTAAHTRMKQLIVAPGNPDYLQSFEEYQDNKRSPLTLKTIHALYSVKTFFEGIF
ncbi:MAG: lamin tail domain-containing protein [Oceanicoccus sp.]